MKVGDELRFVREGQSDKVTVYVSKNAQRVPLCKLTFETFELTADGNVQPAGAERWYSVSVTADPIQRHRWEEHYWRL